MTLDVGFYKSLTASVLPVGAPQTVEWSTKDFTVAIVDASGAVTGRKAGITDITATTPNGVTAICKVTVKAPAVVPTSVKLSETDVYMDWQERRQLSAIVLPEEADQTIVWSSSNQFLLEVDQTGFITPKDAGTATITATASNGVSSVCNVNMTMG